jgi:hypothetical protein
VSFAPIRRPTSLGLATAIAVAAVAASTALPAGAAHAAARSCSTIGLVAAPRAGGHGHVVGLRVTGLTCARARGIARTVAGDVIAGKPVTLSGVMSYSESQTQCTGCASTTQIVLAYPHGKLTISISGGGSVSTGPFGRGGQVF